MSYAIELKVKTESGVKFYSAIADSTAKAIQDLEDSLGLEECRVITANVVIS